MDTEHNKNREKIIHVNKTQIPITEDKLTGRQILELVHADTNQCDLHLVHGHDSRQIGLDEIIEIKNGLHFHVICRVVPYG